MTLPTPTVLLVEDHDDTTDAMQVVLEGWGYEVVTARHGAEALNLLAGGLRPNAIVLDLMMPEADGWDFRRVQRANPRWEGIPVVVVTGMSQHLDVTATQLGLPADQCLLKPVDFDKLLAFLNRAAGGK
jgi:two-component system, chemotaxis family, chemotaxis protein CheY